MIGTSPTKLAGVGLAFAVALAIGVAHARAEVKAEEVEFFEKRVRPVLVEHCYKCHGAEEGKIKGGLRLDSREGLLKGGDTRAAVVPGEPEKSLLIEAVRYTNEELQMPPKEKLSDSRIKDLEEWVRRGAVTPADFSAKRQEGGGGAIDLKEGAKWWAFQGVKDPPIPAVEDGAWAKTDIDRFILAKLEERALRPASRADKRTLIRRATLDLIGLPPTVAEVEAFVADESTEAFSKVVERLLASPHYGERWARHWLDVVRYTDSFDARGTGGAMDVSEAWRYRDWVVEAFNRDLPYDQFITQQVAGDVIASRASGGFDPNLIVATGVFAIGNWGGGDADKEKLITDIVDDQVDVVGRAFLGVTLACARCHDHKFDPITTEDYYGLAGIFFSSHILPNPGPKTNGPDMLRIPLASKAELEERERDKARIAALEKEREGLIEAEIAKLAAEATPRLKEYVAAARGLAVPSADLNPHVLARWKSILSRSELRLLTKRVSNVHNTPGVFAWVPEKGEAPTLTINTRAEEAKFISITMPPKSVAVHPSPKAGVSVALKSPVSGTLSISGSVADVDVNCGDGVEWRLQHNQSIVASGAIANGGKQALPGTSVTVVEGDLIHLAVLPKGGYECDTTAIELTISGASGRWKLSDALTAEPQKGNPHGPWHFVDLAGEATLPAALAKLAAANQNDLAARFDELTKASEADKALREFVGSSVGGFWQPLRGATGVLPSAVQGAIAERSSQIMALKAKTEQVVPVAHGLQEGGCPQSPHAGVHDVKVHIRGRYDRLGKVVPRRFPGVLSTGSEPEIREGSGRVELARWLTDVKNPLTARVMVNRIWQHHFGEGLVRTPNNFGKLGEAPTHPELLDHLAAQFMRSGWSIKAMHRAIMLSTAYQQSSKVSDEAWKGDAENRLFSRMNRRRLDAEQIRDSLLVATGELDRTVRGPAVRDLGTPRRTLYVMTIRSDRSNYRMLFDAADPTAMIDKRIDSTVAPQALFLLNNPFMLARTRALAGRALKQELPDDGARVDWLYQTLFGRPATEAERGVAMRLLHHGGADARSAWEAYCQVLLCTNEFVYVD